MKEPVFIYTRDLCDRYTFSCVNFAARSGRRSALALILSSLLAGTGPAWAVCTTSGGVQTDSGTLAPNSGETVDCTSTNNVSIDNDAAINVTVTVSSGDLKPAATLSAINLNRSATIINDGVITGDSIRRLGTVTIRGGSNRIINRGTIQSTDAHAIEGNLFGEDSTGAVLENFGTISSTSATTTRAVGLGLQATVINSGDILLLSGDDSTALSVSQDSFIQNQASGKIRAVEAQGAGRQVRAVEMSAGSVLINEGTIEVEGNARGTAVGVISKGTTARITNSGTIDASRGGDAIRSGESLRLENSGTIRGGAGDAITISDGENSSVLLQQGSNVEGTISVRTFERVPLTDAELGNDPVFIDFCNKNPTDIACTKFVSTLPSQAVLELEGTGGEDDLITGFKFIDKLGTGTWTLSTDLQAGSKSDGYQSGDFRDSLVIDVQDAGGLLELTGVISDNPDGTLAEIVKEGSGTLRLSGTSTSTGLLSVAQGSLDAAGNIPMTTVVGSGSTVFGTGTLGSLLNNGRVAPGNSVGTLAVTGNYEQQSTGTLDIEIKPDGSANDLLAVGGTAQLAGTLTAQGENGAPLTPAAAGTATSPQVYTILTASGGVSGQFDTDPAPLGAFTFDTTYNADNVQLGVIYAGFTSVQTGAALTPPGTTPVTIPGTGTTNQVSKANALDKAPVVNTGFSSGNTDFDKILLEIANETPDQLAATFNAIIAEPYAAFMTVLLEQNDFYAETVLERAQLCSARGRGSLAGGYSPQQAAGGEPLTAGCPNHERHGVWLDATWLQGSIDGDDGLSGYDYRLAGAVLGVDTAVGTDATVGAAFGYGQPKLNNYDLADAEIDGNSYHLSTYGSLTRDRWEFFGLLGYTWGSYDSERNIRFGSINRTARGNFDGDGFIASAKAAYDYPVTGYDLIPEFGITYSKIWQDGFTEKGADSLNLRVNDADAHSLITSLGVRVGTEFQSGKTSIRPQALLRYEYDWNASDDDAHDIVSSFASVPSLGSIDIIGRNRGEHGLLLAGGVTAQASENTNLFAGAGYRWNSNGEEYNFGVGARIAW
jgi:outer membrane autotransporter protein